MFVRSSCRRRNHFLTHCISLYLSLSPSVVGPRVDGSSRYYRCYYLSLRYYAYKYLPKVYIRGQDPQRPHNNIIYYSERSWRAHRNYLHTNTFVEFKLTIVSGRQGIFSSDIIHTRGSPVLWSCNYIIYIDSGV